MERPSSDDFEYIHYPLLTIAEAARFLGVGKQIVYQLIELDEIRAVREQGRTLVEQRSLEAFRASGKLT
jgi:excisionase family DNA binding protein